MFCALIVGSAQSLDLMSCATIQGAWKNVLAAIARLESQPIWHSQLSICIANFADSLQKNYTSRETEYN